MAKDNIELEPINEDELLQELNRSTRQQFGTQRRAQEQAGDTFFKQLYGTQQTLTDTLRKQNQAAVQTGASKGMQFANELAAVLGIQQEQGALATEQAQKASELASKETEAGLANIVTAGQEARGYNQTLQELLTASRSVDVEQDKADAALGTVIAEMLASKDRAVQAYGQSLQKKYNLENTLTAAEELAEAQEPAAQEASNLQDFLARQKAGLLTPEEEKALEFLRRRMR